ncbi:MAG TPA: hypothetical protein VGL68_07895 [Solirubrobacteraceae bacterium]|jgi:hypothetical protein
MPRTSSVTLQINVAPTDLPHAVSTLPHQLRQWSGQVEEILFTLDLHRTPRGGRFAEGWEERHKPMLQLLGDLCREYPSAHVAPVDYTPAAMHDVARAFTNGSPIPAKDTKGAPFYPYLHGLHVARNDLVFHLDSDIMFGGSSQTWVAEASELLANSEDVLACSPLPGPPARDGRLRGQTASPFEYGSPAFRFSGLSTRLFLIDRERLRGRLLPLHLLGPVRPVSRAKARLHGNPPYRAAELTISDAMRAAELSRVDFLGADPGVWSLHPPFRSPQFYRELPRLIQRIETSDIPNAQRGDYEINDSMFDWSSARRKARIRRLWA